MTVRRLNRFYLAAAILLALTAGRNAALAVEPEVRTSSASLVTRVAPGESLPISIKLTNFGNSQRVDLVIDYRIVNAEKVTVLTSTETVAVQTTASFTKVMQIPPDFAPGTYTAESSITYAGQKVPATSSYQFKVERKIAGIFLSDFIKYGLITLAIGLIFAVASRLVMKRRRASRFAPLEYSKVPAADRMYYEIISDIIMQMRYRIGDKALEVAKSVDSLVINNSDGRVLKIKKKPAQAIALLIANYEKLLGQKVSLAFGKPGGQGKQRSPADNKNMVVIRKRLSEN